LFILAFLRSPTARGLIVMIAANETAIVGHWVMHDGKIVGDEACARIEQLTAHLRRIASDATGWNTLYQDPDDERFWLLTYPQGEMQGGGPPELRCLSTEDAHKVFRF